MACSSGDEGRGDESKWRDRAVCHTQGTCVFGARACILVRGRGCVWHAITALLTPLLTRQIVPDADARGDTRDTAALQVCVCVCVRARDVWSEWWRVCARLCADACI